MVFLLDSGRFETFIDAILAIMMTVMVLKIPQPETLSLSGIMDLSVVYLSYLISFIIIARIWNSHRKLFDKIKKIDNYVIAIYMVLTFIITLVPYFTYWVSGNPYSLAPEICYGSLFILTNVLYLLASHIAVKHDKFNKNSHLDSSRYVNLNLIIYTIFIIGFLIGIYINPIAILISCLLSAIVWNLPLKIINILDNSDTHGY